MGTWIELRCENSGEGLYGPDRCYSDDNSGPMDMAADNQKSVLATVKNLNNVAKEWGWVKTRDGWVCPACHATGSDWKKDFLTNKYSIQD